MDTKILAQLARINDSLPENFYFAYLGREIIEFDLNQTKGLSFIGGDFLKLEETNFSHIRLEFDS